MGKYDRERKALEKEVAAIQPEDVRSPDRWSYLMTCASRLHLLPGRPPESGSEAEFYREVVLNQRLAALDRRRLAELSGRIDFHGNLGWMEHAGRQAVIFCSFHLGSFHSIALILASRGINVGVIANRQAYRNLSGLVEQDMDRLRRKKNYRFNLELLETETAGATLRLARWLQEGRSLLVYLDGNSGPDEHVKGKDFVRVDFLEGGLYVRWGIAALSHRAKVPIIPVISYRDENDRIQVEFFNPLHPDEKQRHGEYARETTRKLFALFSGYVLKYPAQWEGWLYSNHLVDWERLRSSSLAADRERASRPRTYRFNDARYGLMVNKKHYYLFDKHLQQTMRISRELFELLYHGDREEFGKVNLAGKDLMEALLNSEILIESDDPGSDR